MTHLTSRKPVFWIQIAEHGFDTTSKFDITYKDFEWTVEKPWESVDCYLESIQKKGLSDLNIHKKGSPRFSSLLFFGYFGKQEWLTQIDAFRGLGLAVTQVDVIDSSDQLDVLTGKPLIRLTIDISFSQSPHPTGSPDGTREKVRFVKTHKQISKLSKTLGLPMQKVKHLPKKLVHELVEAQLSKILTSSFLDRQAVISFLVADYEFSGTQPVVAAADNLFRTNSGSIKGLRDQVSKPAAHPLGSIVEEEKQGLPFEEMDFDVESEKREESSKLLD
mmetsp:Transcript_4469/g.6656  ORF Transcript_4469/g.6656 Transcript_4469/m.6656 type:complete len:276 (+) Transcript_4469:1286-2113(+)